MSDFVDLVFYPGHIAAMVASWVLIGAAKKAVPGLADSATFARILPFLPISLCLIALWMPGVSIDLPWGSRVVLAVVLGSLAGHVHKVARQAVMGRDWRVQARRDRGQAR